MGKNIKLADLSEAAKIPGINYLYLHLITNFTGLFIDDYFEMLRKTFPDKTIIASGKGIEQSDRTFVNLRLMRRDDEILQFIKEKS